MSVMGPIIKECCTVGMAGGAMSNLNVPVVMCVDSDGSILASVFVFSEHSSPSVSGLCCRAVKSEVQPKNGLKIHISKMLER